MRMIRLSLIACAVSALLVPAAVAQEPPKPGKEHELLKRMEGTWDVTMEGGKGTMSYKMDLGGLWLVGEFEGDFGGMKFRGRGLGTYDPAKKKYIDVWVDSMSTAPMIMEGTADKDGKVLTATGEGPGMDGKPAKFKSVMEHKDADTMQFTLATLDKDGKEQPMMKLTYKRKK